MELLIAIVVLSIIVVPLLHSFVSAARTNAKARNTMHATAIAENVMEEFEAHSIAEMSAVYQTKGFTVEQDIDVDGNGTPETGSFRFTGQDSVTTSGAYDIEVILDPSKYAAINGEKLVDIQNLAGSLNAVFVETQEDVTEAYGVFQAYAGGMTVDTIAKYVTREIGIKINSDKITLDLGDGETLMTEVYLVTANVFYQCDSSILSSQAPSRYPQNDSEYVIFSNENAVREQAAAIKAKKAAGTPLTKDDVVVSKLANVVICVQPRYDLCDTLTDVRDKILVDNSDNVDVNLFVVKQNLTTAEENRLKSKWGQVTYENNLKKYPLQLQVTESAPGWMSSAGASIQTYCKLRTNLLEDTNVKYVFRNVNNSQTVGGVAYRQTGEEGFTKGPGSTGGVTTLTILRADSLAPAKSSDRMYDMIVRVYEKGNMATGKLLIAMTGTLTE